MIVFQDTTSGIDEKKTIRKSQRLKPSVSAAISRAAESVGMEINTFIVSAAYEKALKIEVARAETQIDPAYFDRFAEAISSPGVRVDGLTEAASQTQNVLAED